MSDLPLVIANPVAGGGTGRERWWAASGRLGRHDLVWTEAPGHAERIARAEGNSRPLLIAYGGDGTASEVARGLALSGGSAELGLLPSGTGNDFAGDAGGPGPARRGRKVSAQHPGPANRSRTGRGRERGQALLPQQLLPGSRGLRYRKSVIRRRPGPGHLRGGRGARSRPVPTRLPPGRHGRRTPAATDTPEPHRPQLAPVWRGGFRSPHPPTPVTACWTPS